MIDRPEFNGDVCISCYVDGERADLLDPDWTAKDFLDVTGRTVGGAAILNAFLPGLGAVAGAFVGAFSFLRGKGEGYYNHMGKKLHSGRLYRRDFS
jgi:hypothetical protein